MAPTTELTAAFWPVKRLLGKGVAPALTIRPIPGYKLVAGHRSLVAVAGRRNLGVAGNLEVAGHHNLGVAGNLEVAGHRNLGVAGNLEVAGHHNLAVEVYLLGSGRLEVVGNTL